MSHNITIQGYLSKEPTVNPINDKRDALNFTVASTRSWPDGQGGFNEKTEFFDCAMFRATGKFDKLIEGGRFMKGSEVKVNRCYMETKPNEKDGQKYQNKQFVVDGFGDINNPAMEILSSKAERDYLKMCTEGGHFKQGKQAQAAA